MQKWIAEKLQEIIGSAMTPEQKKDMAFWLAFAWGDILVRELHWEWVMLEGEKTRKSIAVASPSRAHAVPVVQYMERLAMNENADQNSQLLYNMISADKLPPAQPGALKILM